MKKSIFLTIVIGYYIFFMTSCNKNEKYQIQYVAMKLVDSKMWSIVNIESGDILYENEFSYEPSVIINDMFYVKNDKGLYDVYNLNDVKKPINKISYKYITSFNIDGEALAVEPGGGITLIDKNCKVITSFDKSIKFCSNFSKNGTAAFEDVSGKCGLIDKKGNIIIKAKYDGVHNSDVEDEYICITKDGDISRYDIMNTKQMISYSFTSKDYDQIGYFNEGLLSVKKAGDCNDVYYIDKTGVKSIKFGTVEEYGLYQYTFTNNISPFLEGKSWGIKNKSGEILIRAKYESLTIHDKFILAKKNDKWGAINEKDEVLLPFEFNALSYLNDERLITGEYYSSDKDNSFSIIDLNGKDIGTRNFKEINIYGSYGVRSNCFDAKNEANKVASILNENSCNNISAGKTLNDFRSLLKYSEYFYKGDYTLNESDNISGVSIKYAFDVPISRETYENFYGIRLSNGTKFNYNAKCVGVILDYSLKEYPITAESEFVRDFESIIKNKGFKNKGNDYYFENDNGINVGVGYSDGDIKVIYSFTNTYKPKISRKERKADEINKSFDSDEEEEVDSVLIE